MATQQKVDADASPSSAIVEEGHQPNGEALVLRLTAPPSGPRVTWTNETVDNEGMGKRKSKCCCIYKKKRAWDDNESSDESDCETGSCKGHVEKRKDNGDHDGHDHQPHGGEGGPCPA